MKFWNNCAKTDYKFSKLGVSQKLNTKIILKKSVNLMMDIGWF